MDTERTDTRRLDMDAPLIHDELCERSVLGAVLTNRYALDDVRGILTAECFHDPFRRRVWTAISEMDAKGEQPDMVTVPARLAKDGEQCDPMAIVDLVSTASVSSVREHAARLLDLATRRRFWEISRILMQGALTETDEIEEVHSRAKEAIDAVFTSADSHVVSVKETAAELLEHVARNMSSESPISGTPTGFRMIDRNGGLQNGDLIVVAGETSQGKSALALNMAVNAASSGCPVACYSMEMSGRQLTARIVAGRTGIPSSDILFRKVDEQTFARIASGVDDAGRLPVYFDDSVSAKLEKICASIRSMKIKLGIGGAVIDYLQIINLAEKGATREQVVAAAARKFKNLALELGIWIVAISQLARNRDYPQPTMSRLRDSGQIEEAADVIILIYRPEKVPRSPSFPEPFEEYSTKDTALINVAKGRSTGTYSFLARFDGPTTRFIDTDLSEIPLRSRDTARTFDKDEDRPF